MTHETTTGVLAAESARRERWAALGLPDPVRVLAEERATRRKLSDERWRHSDRATLDQHFQTNPDDQPNGW